MNRKIKRVSMGLLASLTIATPIIAISCSKKDTFQKIHDEKNSLLKKFEKTIKQNKSITLKIDETKFNGSIQNNQQLIRYMLIPEYFTNKKTLFNSIIKNQNVIPKLTEYNKWTLSMSQILDALAKANDVKALVDSTQDHIAQATKKIISIADEILSIKEVTIQDSKNHITTYKIEKKMIEHARNILLDTWGVFKIASSQETTKLINKMNLDDPIAFLDSYENLIKESIVKKAIKIIQERTVSIDKVATTIDELIHI
ncbi:MAG: hypothetical protein HRT98_03420 [Mycoplasmatales bacterium]|nr:hypothetical protein [Mycoplasmatales bacterium]